MSQYILCDTCVVIDFINQNSDTLAKLKKQGNILCINKAKASSLLFAPKYQQTSASVPMILI